MTVSLKYIVLSVLSGFAWALIAYCIYGSNPPPCIWAGIAASPLIGLAVGLFYLYVACNRRFAVRLLVSLATLYLAVFLFGLASGVCDAMRPIPNRVPESVVVQMIVACLWAVTVPGWILALWPLSFLNHSLVCRFGTSCSQNGVPN